MFKKKKEFHAILWISLERADLKGKYPHEYPKEEHDFDMHFKVDSHKKFYTYILEGKIYHIYSPAALIELFGEDNLRKDQQYQFDLREAFDKVFREAMNTIGCSEGDVNSYMMVERVGRDGKERRDIELSTDCIKKRLNSKKDIKETLIRDIGDKLNV